VLVGIKYCGGCRASYDRKAEADQAVKDLRFEIAETGVSYDVILAVCGCRSLCADLSPYKTEKVVFISEEGGGAKAAEEIVGYREEK